MSNIPAAEAACALVLMGGGGHDAACQPIADVSHTRPTYQEQILQGEIPSTLEVNKIRHALGRAGIILANNENQSVCPPPGHPNNTNEVPVEGNAGYITCTPSGFSMGAGTYICPNGNEYKGNYVQDCETGAQPPARPTVPAQQSVQNGGEKMQAPLVRTEGKFNPVGFVVCMTVIAGLGGLWLLDKKRHPR